METTTIKDAYRSSYEQLETASTPVPKALRTLRRKAMDRFMDLDFPTTHLEEWRHTNVNAIADKEYILLGNIDTLNCLQQAGSYHMDDHLHGGIMVVVNGHAMPQLSILDDLGDSLTVKGLAEAIADDSASVLAHLGRYVEDQAHPFNALNTAFLTDGAFVHVPPAVSVDQPLHIIHVSVANGTSVRSHPRTLVVAEQGSHLTVVEHFIGLGGETFTNAVTEIVAGEDSSIEYIRVQREPDDTSHVATVQTHQQRNSRLAMHHFITGGGLVRTDVNAALNGEGAEVSLNGLYLVNGHQHVDTHTRIDHIAPHSASTENYKGIMDQHGRAIFNGRIVVHPDAQQITADQTNHNLMLSDQALVNTNPQLEIYADDVKCTHGSTVGQINEEAYFYFQSRGIDRMTAQDLLVRGFAGEIVAGIMEASMRTNMEQLVTSWLTGEKPDADNEPSRLQESAS
jgi:Fe-S cluster assembly protein SufD